MNAERRGYGNEIGQSLLEAWPLNQKNAKLRNNPPPAQSEATIYDFPFTIYES